MNEGPFGSSQLPSEVVAALAQSDDEGVIAGALLDDLSRRLDLTGAAAYALTDGGPATIAHAGSTRLDPAVVPARAGVSEVAGGFGRTIPVDPAWLIVCERELPPDDADRAALAVAADAAVIAVAHARRERRRRIEARSGRALAELGQTLSVAHGESQVLHLLTLAVARLLPQEGVAAWRPQDGELVLVAAAAYPPRASPRPGDRLTATPAVAELARTRRVQPLSSADGGGLVRSPAACVVPIGERDANHALLVVEASVDPGSAEERLLLGVADQALLALEYERLLEAERRTLDAVVACLGQALSVRHERTAEHSDRLTGDCVAVARALGMSGERLRDVAFAAALHDLGKIGIPARVLDNRGPLGEEDWKLIRSHPEMGARIIDPVPALAGTAALIRACHEHWDGSGYPRGLRGEEIPLGARVVFACDAYHAMREDRPYQPPLSDAEATGRLQELSGVHFDPRVVDALLAHLAQQRPAQPSVTG